MARARARAEAAEAAAEDPRAYGAEYATRRVFATGGLAAQLVVNSKGARRPSAPE